MTAISKIENIERSITWVLLGLFGVFVFVSVLGALSPLWALWRYELADEAASHSRDLLEMARAIAPWFSLLFIVAAWHLGKAARTTYGRWIVVAFGVSVSVTFMAEQLFDISLISPVWGVFFGFQFISLLVYLALIRKYLRDSRLT
jgi:hypothetical protein